ncbi:MAG: AI-2E family transporter [Solobacterium sp.]|nr:AI-2E family transporter [Solobacterium sp.]MBQ9152976.1 AI-2E family transporter [Solobacterium sp.]
MKFHLSEQAKEAIRIYSIAGVIVAAFCFLVRNLGGIASYLGSFLSILSPFFLGFAIAFVLLPLRRIVENRWLSKFSIGAKGKRRIAVGVSVVVLLLAVTGLFLIMIPQLISSFQSFVNSFDGYMNRFEELLNSLTGEEVSGFVSSMVEALENWVREFATGQNGVLAKLVNYSVSIVNGIFNCFVGVIVAVYLMLDQEKFVSQMKRLITAAFGPRKSESIYYVGRLTAKMFNSFIFGKALDSFIIGVICWISCTIMRIPYAPLISVVIGITNMIPVFGPFIGAVPSILILLFISPMKALEFLIFIVILQQVDGNILGPYILGDSMGLPAIWIMFAIIVGGSLFGMLGMVLGVPVFSVFYILTKDWINKQLADSEMMT